MSQRREPRAIYQSTSRLGGVVCLSGGLLISSLLFGQGTVPAIKAVPKVQGTPKVVPAPGKPSTPPVGKTDPAPITKPAAPAPAKPKEPVSSLAGQSTAAIEHQIASRQKLARGITLARMTNGLTILVQENHSAPVATVRCYVQNTGSAYEGKDLGAGLSHVLEHTVAGGSTSKRTETQIRELLDSLGGQTNAYTSDEITTFLIDCPASGVNLAIQLIAENMQFSLIPQPEYDRELGVVQRELEMGEADRSRVMYNQMKQLVYQVHPKRHPTIGYLNVVRQITREGVFEFYKNRYVPQNMVFVVVGDVSTDVVLEDTVHAFKDFQRTTERFEVLAQEPEQAAPRSAQLSMEGTTTHWSIAWPTVSLQEPELYPLDVASCILTNGDSSRLVRRLRVEQPLAINVSSVSNTPGGVKGWFQITVECQPEKLAEVQKIVFEEVERLKSEPVQAGELAKAKRQKAADHVFGQQTVENQAEMLSESYRSTGDPLFDTHYVEGIQTVSVDQIQEVAKRFLRPERLNTVTIEPLSAATNKTEDQQAEASETGIQKTVLDNGLTILLKRQTTLPMVTIQAYVRAGVVAESPETAGLASLTAEMLEKGTEKYTADQIAEYFDSIGGALALASQTNTSYLQSNVLKEDADQALDYIYQVLCHPTFPEEEFSKVQQIRLARIAARGNNPQTEIMDFFAKQLSADSPYSRQALGRVETVGKLTVDDLKKFHAREYQPGNMIIAVFGDIEPDKMLEKLKASFGTMPAGTLPERPKFELSQPALEKDLVQHLKNQKKNTGMVLLAFPTVSVKNEQTRATLELLDAVLTGGGAAGGRLHEDLRGRQLVYYVFGIQMTGFAPGHFVFLAQTRPEAIPEVVSRIRQGIDRIRTEGVPADEFEKAKAKLIVARSMRNTTPGERAFQASVDELYGLGYDYEKNYAERIRKVTVEDLQKVLSQQFLHPLIVTTAPGDPPKLTGGDKPAAAAKAGEKAPGAKAAEEK